MNAAGGPGARPLRLSSTTLSVALDPTSGAVRRLAAGAWTPLADGDPATGWALRVPLPGRRNNVADADDQEPPTWQTGEDGGLTAVWSGIRSQYGGWHDIEVRAGVRADAERLVFTMDLDNRSEYVVEDVRYPRLGTVRPPGSGMLHAFAYRYAAGRHRPLLPRFDNVPGYYGVDRPTYLNEGEGTVGAPVCPFVLLEDGERGLYLAVDEPSAELVAWLAELHPGYGDSLLHTVAEPGDHLPEPAGLRVYAAHLPYVRPGERRRLTPVALAAYTGDWHHGVDLYRARRDAWLPRAARPPHWAAEPHAWLQLHVNSPEDELRLPFAELPAVAAACRDHGISVIQLVGWNDGGQDRNNPSHDADPRLGGPQALRAAVAQCQALGVRVVLFTKFTWADRSTERFRTELVHDAVTDPYGDYYLHHGYRYQTVAQLLDVNTRRLVPMCFASPHYREVAGAQFDTVLSYGADGMLFDESLHHSPALLCFDERHGHRPGHPVYGEDAALLRGFRERAAGRDAGFLYAGEACYDWEFTEYELSYHRSEDPEHIPLSRYLRPHAQLMTAVTGFDDRNMVNHALMYRYVLSYEPYHFKGRPTDMPRTIAYGRAMDALRTELRPWFWDGEFRDTVGARVRTRDGGPHRPYAVFAAADGTIGLVVVNYAADRAVDVLVEGPAGGLRARLVDGAGWHDATGGIHLPPRSAAVVVPAGARQVP